MDFKAENVMNCYRMYLEMNGEVSCRLVAEWMTQLGYRSRGGGPISRQQVQRYMALTPEGRAYMNRFSRRARRANHLSESARREIIELAQAEDRPTFREIGAKYGVTDAHVNYLLATRA